jgi:hypothetical protein
MHSLTHVGFKLFVVSTLINLRVMSQMAYLFGVTSASRPTRSAASATHQPLINLSDNSVSLVQADCFTFASAFPRTPKLHLHLQMRAGGRQAEQILIQLRIECCFHCR